MLQTSINNVKIFSEVPHYIVSCFNRFNKITVTGKRAKKQMSRLDLVKKSAEVLKLKQHI